MLDSVDVGAVVTHRVKPEWGLGKVVQVTGAAAWVYFLDHPGQAPDDRVLKFNLPTDFLIPSSLTTHADLDHLPAYADGHFRAARVQFTLKDAREGFLKRFPQGFEDPDYWREERGYKVSAHERFTHDLSPSVKAWVDTRNYEAIRKGLLKVYAPTGAGASGLNLMNPQFEFPAFKDSLNSDSALIAFVEAALAFAAEEETTEAAFNRLAEAVAALPARAGGTPLKKWTVLTWLPFIANPTAHMFLKPEMSQAFAAIIPFDLKYESRLNHETYGRLQLMSRQLKDLLNDVALNPTSRELDMIDVQSFMWAVHDYIVPRM